MKMVRNATTCRTFPLTAPSCRCMRPAGEALATPDAEIAADRESQAEIHILIEPACSRSRRSERQRCCLTTEPGALA